MVRKWAHNTEIQQERWHNKGWKIINDSYAVSNAIGLIVFLITGKFVKFYQNVFCFFKIWFWIGQYHSFHTIFDKFYFLFKDFCFLWPLCLHEFEMWYGCVLKKKNLLHQLKKLRDDPEIPKKLFFWFIWGWKYAKSKH